MSVLLHELFDLLDVGVGIFCPDSLRLVESNALLNEWLTLEKDKHSLADHLTQDDLTRLKKSICKGRIFRLNKLVSINSRLENISFKAHLTTLSDQKSYLLVQGVINNSERESKRIMKEYTIIDKKNKKLLEQEKEKALEANAAKSMFIATMSHELRTPMNGILGMAQKLRSGHLDATQQRSVRAIESSGKQLLAIINEILDFSKIESNKLELHTQPVDVKSLTLDVLEICSGGIETRNNVKISADIPSSHIPYILVDDVRLRQILINLLSNAIKFTEQGSVVIALDHQLADEKHAQLIFTITDSGIGMLQEKIDHLFEAFTQHDASTTRRYGGTGLGLAICNQLVELMQGDINVTSELGKGSEFKVLLTLPIADLKHELKIQAEGGIQDSVETQKSLEKLDISGKKILIVEDTPINQEVIIMALEDCNVDIAMANDGQQALALFEQSHFDIILMDCLMPVMDGFRTARAIRKLETNGHHIPIIAITASTTDEIAQRCHEAGMDDVMHKPFNFDVLVNKVKHWVSQDRKPS